MEKDWKEVYMTASEYKAEIAKVRLEAAGIKVVILNQHDTAIQAFGEYRLYIAEKNIDAALELLKDLKGE